MQSVRYLESRPWSGDAPDSARSYQSQVNEVFPELGIGWKMVDGKIQTRGAEVFEASLKKATDALTSSGRQTAASELRKALFDLSRRPEPDLTGAVQRSAAALECVARSICGDPKAMLGKLLERYRDRLAIPKPLDIVVEKAWGPRVGDGMARVRK